MKSRYYLLATIYFVLSLFWVYPTSAQTVNVPDAKLAAILRRAFNLNPNQDIPRNFLLNISGLSLVDKQIRDLTGLEHATNLQRIVLGSNQVSDIRPLSGLTKLTHLYLDSNRISDIDALSGLTNLQILDISFNRISDLTPLSQLTNITWLSVGNNPITELRPLSNLVNLTFFVIDPDFDEKYPRQIRRYIPASAQIVFLNPDEDSGRPVPREELRQQAPQHCGLGWSPYAYHHRRPKVMIYALEFEYKQQQHHNQYACTAIEIRTGDPAITDLDGWKLYLGTRYNPSYIPITLSNAPVIDGVLRLTPDMLGLETFRCNTVYVSGRPLPGVHYVLKSDKNLTIDTAYSCFVFGQIATTQDKGIWEKSDRRLSSDALRAMDTPRMERYILKPNSIYITYMDIADFGWDRFVLSDWLLPAGEESVGAAPSVYKRLTTSWGALKQVQR